MTRRLPGTDHTLALLALLALASPGHPTRADDPKVMTDVVRQVGGHEHDLRNRYQRVPGPIATGLAEPRPGAHHRHDSGLRELRSEHAKRFFGESVEDQRSVDRFQIVRLHGQLWSHAGTSRR